VSGLIEAEAIAAGYRHSLALRSTTYTITATAGADGSINPSGAVTVSYGADQTFTIAANTGYHIAEVLVDGASASVASSYTFTNVTTNHTIAASFTTLATPTIITASPLPEGEVGVAYSQTLTASWGTSPYNWSIDSGTLPAGLSLSGATISGTPTTAGGPTTITFQVTDSLGRTATKDLSFTILEALTITTASPLPEGEVGVAYSQTLTASGGTSPYRWSIASGSLQASLWLSGATISGTPTTGSGPTTITFQVTDSLGRTATKDLSFTILATSGWWSVWWHIAAIASGTVIFIVVVAMLLRRYR
jgi:hypothetical protein